jgi:hypothetical protein
VTFTFLNVLWEGVPSIWGIAFPSLNKDFLEPSSTLSFLGIFVSRFGEYFCSVRGGGILREGVSFIDYFFGSLFLWFFKKLVIFFRFLFIQD